MASQNNDQALNNLLAKHKKPLWLRLAGWGCVGLVVIAGVYFMTHRTQEGIEYITVPVERGAIDVTVTADGTLHPTRVVSLGSSLSGIVESVNVDVNDNIKKGQVLIQLDPSTLQARVLSAEASLALAQAKLKEAQARFEEAKKKYERMQNLNKLSGGKLPTPIELDTQRAAMLSAQAGLSVAKAQIDEAKASVSIARSDLAKTKIRSPIDGVVLSRNVEPGYAVAASLQAVQLLELATDLSVLELEVAVDEADIGVVKSGQPSYFTVSAYPNRRFPAQLTKVAFGSKTSNNVVTYTAYLKVNNKDNLLRPGMTASTTIATGHESDALIVPNSAFRFEMPEQGKDKPKIQAGAPHRKEVQKHRKESVVHGELQRTLYVLRDGKPELVHVTTGLNNGVNTAVTSEELHPGDTVIIDIKKRVQK